jgi:hypothetical protein
MSRAQLESGLKLDVNRLLRRRFIRSGAVTGPIGIKWTDTYFDEEIASGWITADLSGPDEGWLRINLGSLDQRLVLAARKRHFGGRQWFFICPYMNRRAMVLWIPPGARSFACRERWGRQVAYASQFLDRCRGNSTLVFDPQRPPLPRQAAVRAHESRLVRR